MKLSISSEKESLDLEVEFVQARTSDNTFTLLENHAPLVAELRAGPCLSYKEKSSHIIKTFSCENGGIINFINNQVIVVAWEETKLN